jgi:DNA repair photolyase
MNKDYWYYRDKIKGIIPRKTILFKNNEKYTMKQKGRKSNYNQFHIGDNQMVKMERLLDSENINSFAEVSLRAQSCPMPFNIDVWDGLKCPYQCRYCFADYFRHSLYTSFFDNGAKLGLRHCSIENHKNELQKLMKHRGEKVSGNNEVINAVRLQIPIRLGIRFEDFPPIERKKQISLELLRYLRDIEYPVMINTKSDIPGEEPYLEALAENKAGAAIHFTLISNDEEFLKNIEPGAPSFQKRLEAARKLSAAGVRVVARIEPWMIFLNDEKEKVDEYIRQIKAAGINHMTFDSYSYSANSKGLSSNFEKIDIDFQRMFLLSSDSQGLSSFLLGKFMEYFQDNGINCSTFDQGNVPDNDDWICCSVGDHFEKYGFNWGSGVIAIKLIQHRSTGARKLPTRWSDFVSFVESKGGFLSDSLRLQVHQLWNGEGDAAWPIFWGHGIYPVGNDQDGLIYEHRGDEGDDFREQIIEGVIQ